MKEKVYFIGAGPGDPELITLKAYRLIEQANVIIYAGSLVNERILDFASKQAKFFNSAKMTLDEIIAVIKKSFQAGQKVIRLHTGDPSLYGAIYEQMQELDKLNIPYEIIPGVTSLFAATAKLQVELTAPNLSQTVIISRVAGKTKVPSGEALEKLACHGGTFVFYLSAKSVNQIKDVFLSQGWSKATPVAICYKVSWEDEKIIKTTLADLPTTMAQAGLSKHLLLIIGNILDKTKVQEYSRLYAKDFVHEYRSSHHCLNS